MSRPFAVIGFSMLFTLAALFFLPEWVIFPVLALAAAGLTVALLRHKRGESFLWVAAALSAMLACVLLLVQLRVTYYPALAQTGDNLAICAQVISNPEENYGRYYYELRVRSINGTRRRLKARLSAKYPLYAAPYDEITYTGALFALGGDDPAWLERYKAQGIYLGSYAAGHGEDPIQVLPKRRFHFRKAMLQLQAHIDRTIVRNYSAQTAGLLRGMLLGRTNGLSWTTAEQFRRAGISHLFSVSGLHVSLLTWALYRLLRGLRCKRRAAVLVCCAFLFCFMALIGFAASGVRAGLMMFLLLGGKLANRRPDSLNSLGFAAMLLAGCSPLSAGQLGLQMSFGATLGILLLQGKCSAPGRNYLERKKAMPSLARTGLLFANDGLGLTASATALVLPVQLLRLSSGFSLLAFPANLFFVPLSGIFFQLGAVSAVLKPLAPLVELLGTLMLRGVSRLNRAPAPVLRGGPAATISLGLCAAVAGLVLLLYYIGKAPKLRFAAALIGIILLCGCWAPGFSQRNRTVAQVLETEGTAVLVHKNGQAALLGCGGGAMAAATAKRALDTLGILQLQTLLIPGASEKLAAGAPELLRDVSITQVIRYEDCGIFTPFVLWDTDAGIFYCAENNAACLLRLGEERFVLRFAGEPPAQWRAFPRLEGGLA